MSSITLRRLSLLLFGFSFTIAHADGYKWKDHLPPFDFLFENHIYTHQQSTMVGKGSGDDDSSNGDGQLQLGAAQGNSAVELYAAALIANLYWLPGQYSKIALYFREVEKKNLMDVPARDVLSRKFSSAFGFKGNIVNKLAAKDLLPGSQGRRSQGCSV